MCEDTPGRSLTPSAMGGYSKKTAIYEPGNGNNESVTTLILDLTGTRLQEKGWLFLSYPVYEMFVKASWMD